MALGTSPATDRTVMLVSSDQKFVDSASRFLNGHKVHTARNVTDAQRRMVEEHIDLAVLDSSYATESGVIDGGQLLQVDPDLPIVLVAATLDMSVLRVALRIGYKDVVDSPVDRAKMEAMLNLIEDQAQREILKESKTRIGRIITVMSPKGGAGKTMTTANVSLQLARWGDPSRVVVVDAGRRVGEFCIAVQIDPVHTIVEASR